VTRPAAKEVRMGKVQHKTFIGPLFDLNILKSWADTDAEVRRDAEKFINEIGTDRLVDVTERTDRDNRIVIVVWYRSEA
jgi:hypothetical protein